MDSDLRTKVLAAIRFIGAVWITSRVPVQPDTEFLQVAAFLWVIPLGQTAAVLTGGIDLSQAGMVTLTNIVSKAYCLGTTKTSSSRRWRASPWHCSWAWPMVYLLLLSESRH
jgi:ribose/xylose/arabinose/galactoside ABC-type transport system permease subunit